MIQEMFPAPLGFFSSQTTTLEISESDLNQSQNGKQQISKFSTEEKKNLFKCFSLNCFLCKLMKESFGELTLDIFQLPPLSHPQVILDDWISSQLKQKSLLQQCTTVLKFPKEFFKDIGMEISCSTFLSKMKFCNQILQTVVMLGTILNCAA